MRDPSTDNTLGWQRRRLLHLLPGVAGLCLPLCVAALVAVLLDVVRPCPQTLETTRRRRVRDAHNGGCGGHACVLCADVWAAVN